MSFDKTKWQCAACGRFGTLCLRTVGVTTHGQVCKIGSDSVATTILTQRGGRSEGYVCCACGMRVADTPKELIEQLGY